MQHYVGLNLVLYDIENILMVKAANCCLHNGWATEIALSREFIFYLCAVARFVFEEEQVCEEIFVFIVLKL